MHIAALMALSVTFCQVPLSTSVDSRSAGSFVTLDWLWVLSSGIPAHQFVVSGICEFMTSMTSLNLLRDIFLRYYATCCHISSFMPIHSQYSDLLICMPV
jgi:hypothetical protein